MRKIIISYLKQHPKTVRFVWDTARLLLQFIGLFIPIKKERIIFCSYGGRSFNDSPKALYDKILKMNFFSDYDLIWAFDNPNNYHVKRGKKIKIDTITFFYYLLSSGVWISNSGMDRGIGLKRKRTIKIETWHGTPLKKILGDENQTALGGKKISFKGKPDKNTIRCSQSDFDRQLFARLFNADIKSILKSDLPRNDVLVENNFNVDKIKHKLGIPLDKKVILYTPTYREYLIDENYNTYIAPPLDMKLLQEKLSKEYVFLVRAHYAVTKSLNLEENDFVYDVSDYPDINHLYLISDILLSDYSSTYFDYSILDRPILCFAYDLEEYQAKRGLYLNLDKVLPCRIDKTEQELIDSIMNLNYDEACKKTHVFHKKYAPYAGESCKIILNVLMTRLK